MPTVEVNPDTNNIPKFIFQVKGPKCKQKLHIFVSTMAMQKKPPGPITMAQYRYAHKTLPKVLKHTNPFPTRRLNSSPTPSATGFRFTMTGLGCIFSPMHLMIRMLMSCTLVRNEINLQQKCSYSYYIQNTTLGERHSVFARKTPNTVPGTWTCQSSRHGGK